MIAPYHRMCLCLAILAVSFVSEILGLSQEPVAPVADREQVLLQIGDKAPKLEVDHWLGGGSVSSFSNDNVYVVEFWATWCAPCIKSMPHLSELAERYSKDGLIVVAMTKTDATNTREAVEEFINGHGKAFRFRYGLCESDVTYNAYMEASGQQGIPCSFVVDREGKVAYIGHPHDLDYVLERIFSGNWRGKADADEIREMNESITKLGMMAQSDPDKALQIVEHIRRVNPQRTKSLDFSYVEVMVLCRKEMYDRAKEVIESLCQDSSKATDWGGIAMLSSMLASKESNPQGKHVDFAIAKIEAAEAALKDDWQNLIQVGVAYQLLGNAAKCKECMDKAIEMCPDEQVKKTLRMAIEMQQKASGN